MSEIPHSDDEISIEAKALAEKDEWIQRTADLIVRTRLFKARKMNPELVIDGVRWASLWLDEFRDLMKKYPPTSQDDVKQKIEASQHSALSRSESKYRHPNGVPSLQMSVAANDAFCLGFYDDAAETSALLGWPMEEYGITEGS